MPTISFSRLKTNPIEVTSGVNLMKALLEKAMPVASSCSGDGVCGKCRIKIVSGVENLSRPTDAEKLLKNKLNIENDFRISCQTYVLGDISIDASYW